MTGAPLMPIGAFARMTRISVKALRHYDAEGLLEPAWVDPASGYRYYSPAQVPDAATITVLRSADVPLGRIRDVLAADDAGRAALIAAERERVAAELDHRRRALATLERLVASPALTSYDVAIEGRRPSRLWSVTAVASADRVDVDTAQACERLASAVMQAGLREAPFVGVFPLDLDEAFPIAVGVPAPEPAAQPPAGLARLAVRGGTWATTMHAGPYQALPSAYAAVLARVRDLGHVPAGPVCETYLSDPTSVPELHLLTAVSVALAD